MTRIVPALVFTAVALAFAPPVHAQSGVTVTPDRLTHLVNKDLAGERWTISLNLSVEDPARRLITNVTGNVFRTGEAPAFIVCQPAPDSSGTLADPSSLFRFSCDVAPACGETALACSRSAWSLVTRSLELPASFFLPGADGAAGRSDAVPLATTQQAVDRGATLSYDGLSYLVSKDVQNERWSIVANFAPRLGPDGGVRKELASITGNVFKRDGSAPQFVYCEETEASQGDLGNPASLFRLRCLGADACTAGIDECAGGAWRLVADGIELPADFFLPEAGSGEARSDPEIVIIGRASDPPSIATDEYTVPGGAGSSSVVQGGACAGACVVEQLGECRGVTGDLRTGDDGRCLCFVTDPATSCITCGAGAVAGQCGATCSFPVGSRTARGVCRPFASASSECVCSALGADGGGAPSACGGPLASACPGDRCCVDDPSDGCDSSQGDPSCAGTCVATGGCDPTTQQCGACVDPCGNGVAEGLEQCDGADLRGATCTGGGTLACRGDCTIDTSGCSGSGGPCGNGRVDSGESCDGSDLGGATCASLGFDGGTLSCDAACTLDTAGCTTDPDPPASAPVITSLTCNGRASCTILPSTSFDVSFSYTDPDGDASQYELYLDGAPFFSGSVSAGGQGVVSLQLVTGTCPDACCATTDFSFTATVADAAGNVSDVAGPLVQTTDYDATCR